MVSLHLVIGEMVPKNLAMAAPEKTALWLSPGLVGFARLCRPVTAALGACARLVLRLFGVEPRDEVEAVFTSEQLNRLVEDSGRPDCWTPRRRNAWRTRWNWAAARSPTCCCARSRLVTVDALRHPQPRSRS